MFAALALVGRLSSPLQGLLSLAERSFSLGVSVGYWVHVCVCVFGVGAGIGGDDGRD